VAGVLSVIAVHKSCALVIRFTTEVAATACKIPPMPDIALHYHLLAAALPSEEKRIRTSYVPTLVLVVAASTFVFVALGLSKGAAPKLMITYGLMMAAYIAYLLAWYPRRMRRRLIRCWETYDLEIGHDYLVRRQADIPDLRLHFDEVQTVEHVRGRYLRVIGKSKGHVIAIPEGIDQFGEVLKTISSVCPVRVRTVEQWQKYRAFMAAGLLLFVIMIWATSPVVVVPLSLATGSAIVWVFFWIRRNPNISINQKRIAWIYWLFFFMCILKLLVAVEGDNSVKAPAIVGNMLAYMLVFSPCVLLTVGWVRWWRVRPPRYWRNYAIAWGLATGSISALCLYGVLSYVQLAHIGRSNEHRLAIAGGYVGFPLSAFSVVAAVVGSGRSRVIAWLAGGSLAVVWSIAFFYA
jgi:uncharacterized membrane protein